MVCLYIMDIFMSAFIYIFFFFNDTATTEIYTLSLHDALPTSSRAPTPLSKRCAPWAPTSASTAAGRPSRSEEHTSELQSHHDLVCRLLLEKKKKKTKKTKKKQKKTQKKNN